MTENKQPLLTKTLVLIALGHAFTDLSQGALPVLLPYFKNAFGLTYAQVGLIVFTQNFSSSVIQPVFGYFSDRFPMFWLVPAALMLAGLGTAATGLAPSYPGLLAIIIITGLGIAAFHPQGAKVVYNLSALHNRGQSMAVFSLGGNLGNACGSVFMTILLTMPGAMSNTVYFCLPALVLSLLVWMNLSRLAPKQAVSKKHKDEARSTRPLSYAMLAILLSYIFLRTSISTGLTAYIPLYYADFLGGSPIYASFLLSTYLLSGVAGTYIGGILGDRYGRKTVIVGSMLLALPLLSLLRFTSGYWTFGVISLTGLIYISSFSSTIVLAQEMMPGHEALAASLTTGFSIGMSGITVTLLGFVADHFGVPSVFAVISAIPLGALALASLFPGKLFTPDRFILGKNKE